jgi:hypothetical protein
MLTPDEATKQQLQVLLYYYRERCNDSRLKAGQYGMLWLNFIAMTGALVAFGIAHQWMPGFTEVPAAEKGRSSQFLLLCAISVIIAGVLFGYAHLSHYAVLLSLNRLEKRIFKLDDTLKPLQNESWYWLYREQFVSPIRRPLLLGVSISTFGLLVLAAVAGWWIFYLSSNLWNNSGKGTATIIADLTVVIPVAVVIWIFAARYKIY